MNAVFSKISEELEHHHDLMLVTITSKSGSSPRGAGAQMLVGEGGRLCGTIGGGAAEHRSEETARTLLQKKRSGEYCFKLREQSGNDLGMVCGGEISVFFQYIDPAAKEWKRLVSRVLVMLSAHQPGQLVLHLDGSLPMLLDGEGRPVPGIFPEVCDSPGESGQAAEPPLPSRTGAILPSSDMKCRKTKTSFTMPLPVQDRAVIFGGGHCTQALVPVLSRIDFRITVIDNRPELSLPKLFPEAEAVLCGDYFHISDYLDLTPSDYVVVMTNGHTHDFDVLRQILQNPPAYVGVIGSRRKTAFVNQKLLECGIDKEVLSRVHAPIGTAIKAVTPEEIAVSIAGEMIYERALLREAREIRTAQGCPMH